MQKRLTPSLQYNVPSKSQTLDYVIKEFTLWEFIMGRRKKSEFKKLKNLLIKTYSYSQNII